MNRTLFSTVFLSGLLSAGAASATCFSEAAARYKLPEDLLRAVVKVESGGRPEAMNLGHKTRTGTYDIGLMQINSSWLKKLKTYSITEEMLKEPCQNVLVGAWILSHHLKETGADWNGVGSYNASCRTLSADYCKKTRYGYSWKVYQALMKLRNTPVQQAKPADTAGKPIVVAVAAQRTQRSIRTVASEEGATVASELAESAKPVIEGKAAKVHEPASVQIAHAPIEEMELVEAEMDDDQPID